MYWLWLSIVLVTPLLADDETQAREILTRRCVSCHDGKARMGGLDLSSREAALRGGAHGPALREGAWPESLLWARIVKGEMPPAAPLPSAEQEVLKRWLVGGAAWRDAISVRRAGRDWWSLQPLAVHTAPLRPGIPSAWAGSVIDRWVYAKLQDAGLQASPPADRRTLIRRLSLDLLGLPPSPQEVRSFLADSSPQAYEKLVDRMLASPHYGERWARHWLDVVRYAESEGFERDWIREHAWPYRDYVIRSLNEDKSYRQFAREQIAGDVMEGSSHESLAATSMLVLGPYDAVGLTSAVAQERALTREDQLEEMVGVVSQTFLGLTVNCARCHDHKFDPIPQKDYYRMKAVFAAVHQPSFGSELRADGRFLLTPAEAAAREKSVAAAQARIKAAEDELGQFYVQLRARKASGQSPLRPVARWTFDADARDEAGHLHAKSRPEAQLLEGRLRPSGSNEFGYLVTLPLHREIREKTLEAWVRLSGKPKRTVSVFQIRNRSGYRGAAFDGIRLRAGHWDNGSTVDFRWQDVGGPAEDFEKVSRVHVAMTFSPDNSIRIYRNGVPYGNAYTPDLSLPQGGLQTYFANDAIVEFSSMAEVQVEEARLYDRALGSEELARSYADGIENYTVEELTQGLSPAEEDKWRRLQEEVRTAEAAEKALPVPQKAFAASIQEVEPTKVLLRGDVNRPGEVVAAGGLSALGSWPGEWGLAPDTKDAERRRALAEWIAHEKNPLFARVMVNRIWRQHFGNAFVESPNDFGFNGGAPTHPELLDALARQFIESGWSLKKLHKTMVMSETYRQSSAWVAAAAEKDAENRLYWRYSPRRVEAEVVRDAMLSASGALNKKMYGPSFRPFEIVKNSGSYHSYQPVDTADQELQRRSVYRMNVTTGGNPMLDALDCPNPAVKTPKRSSTTTPLQALSLMNNAFVQRQARLLAERLRRESGSADAQIDLAFELTLGREPQPDERASSRELVSKRGLDALCWGLFNTSEFLYVE